MKFTVVAGDSVEQALDEIWMETEDRQAVTDAANWIDRELKTDPLTKVTRIDNYYFIRRAPLVALCRVNIDDRVVTIVEMHRSDEP